MIVKIKSRKRKLCKKGKGGSKIQVKSKIQPDEVRNIANTIRDRLFLYNQITNALDEYKEETTSELIAF